MFNKNFYPTPYEVAQKMVEGLTTVGKTILEPSAGKGDLLEAIRDKWNTTIYCIEKNSELREVLKGKDYGIIGEDFLKFESDIVFDIILMNPPFDNGTKHFLKAWNISEGGTEIRCLLNAESIRNPYTKDRELMLKIIEDNNGTIEFLGDCFSNAERKTNVEIALISITNNEKKSKFTFEYEEDNFKIDDLDLNSLSKVDVIENLVDKYNRIKELISGYIKISEEIKYYADDIFKYDTLQNVLEGQSGSPTKRYNSIMERIKRRFWGEIFDKTKIGAKLTSSVRQDFYKEQEVRGIMPFTRDNIEELLEILMMSSNQIFKKCIEECFDHLTKYHPENREHIEGWKTNERWVVGKKFVLPHFRSWLDIKYQGSDNFTRSIDYTGRSKIDDLEKALSHICKKSFENIESVPKVVSRGIYFGCWYESEYFKFKLFKKGTMHFIFKDEKLREEFNRLACESKNWLGYK